VLKKAIPFGYALTTNEDTINGFRTQIEGSIRLFQSIEETFRATPGATRPFNQRHINEVNQNIQECRRAFNKLKAVLPANVEGNQGLASELLGKFQRLLKENEIIGLRENIAHSTASLQVLLHMIAMYVMLSYSHNSKAYSRKQR
jgi:hypothetical protein